MYQASRIPEEKLRPIFEESEWRWLQKEFDEARSREAMLRAVRLSPRGSPGLGNGPQRATAEPGDHARPDRPAVKGTGGGGRHSVGRRESLRHEPIEPAPSDRRPRNDPADRGPALTLGVAIATVTSALALGGSAAAASSPPRRGAGTAKVTVEVKTAKAAPAAPSREDSSARRRRRRQGSRRTEVERRVIAAARGRGIQRRRPGPAIHAAVPPDPPRGVPHRPARLSPDPGAAQRRSPAPASRPCARRRGSIPR